MDKSEVVGGWVRFFGGGRVVGGEGGLLEEGGLADKRGLSEEARGIVGYKGGC